ncbi:MAG: NUDIX hydrolase [Patescibacteria group bacterium]|jgi:8-oxo-dGTP pyrophosphatase MutT (NUDIX family)
MSEPGIKTSSVSFLPYKIKGNEISIFLQKRTSDAPTFPGAFFPFGGETETGEDSRATLIRELQEELVYKPVHEKYVGALEYPGHTIHVYIEQVEDDFQNIVKVMEGDYGKFLTEQEICSESEVPQEMKKVIPKFFDIIRSFNGKQE